VDIWIFFNNKIFLSIFWLDIWWGVVRHSSTPLLQLWWDSWVLAAEKWLEPQKKRNSWFLLRWIPPKIIAFFVTIAKVRSLPIYFM